MQAFVGMAKLNEKKLDGRVALVTGASSGIGAATASKAQRAAARAAAGPGAAALDGVGSPISAQGLWIWLIQSLGAALWVSVVSWQSVIPKK